MNRSLPAQLWRFAAVGISNSAVTLLSYSGLLGAGLPYLVAGAAAFVLGALNGFALNRTWTFAHDGALGASGLRYLIVALMGLGADLALLHAGVSVGLGHLAAQGAAMGPVTLLCFVLNRGWTFRPRDTKRSDAPSSTPHLVAAGGAGPRGRRPLRARGLAARRGRPADRLAGG